MNIRRVLTLSITLLIAAGAGYGLLGLKTPKQAPQAPASPAAPAATRTIIAVGPDGRLYAIQAPASAATPGAYGGDGQSRYGREEGGRYSDAYEHE